jgi:tetratricopeptide (TPR) repeat protein
VNNPANPTVLEAVKLALKARRIYYEEGKLTEALALYRHALYLSLTAKEYGLVAYIRTHICNIEGMIGNFTQVELQFAQAQDGALRLCAEAQRLQDNDLYSTGQRILGEARLRYLWANYWAKGPSFVGIREAEQLEKDFRKFHNHTRMPQLYNFFARTLLALGDTANAVEYIDKAVETVLALPHQYYARYALFLDGAGCTASGRIDYQRHIDQIFAANADVHIAADQPEEAFIAYQMITVHREPQADLSWYYWFRPSWQQYLHGQIQNKSFGESRLRDKKLEYDFDDWNQALEDTQDKRVQALITYSQAENDEASGDLPAARLKYQRAAVLGQECGADDLFTQGIIAASHIAVIQKNKPLAVSKINSIQDVIHKVDNPQILAKYRQVQQAIVQL